MSDENPVDESPAGAEALQTTDTTVQTADTTVQTTDTTVQTTDAAVETPDTAVETPDATVEETIAEEPKPRMELSQLKAVIEALVFASPDPLTPRMLNRLLNDEPKEDVQAALKAVQADYVERGGLHMAEVAGGFQITTRPEYHEWVRRLFHERSSNKLSAASLETLSVIAYKQPVTAAEIGEIRSVNTSGVLSTLLERHLIKIVGRKNVIGRPFLYGTTKEFLIRFGLNDLNDLPKIEDMAQQLGFDAPAVLMERPIPEEMLPLEEGDVPDDQPD